MSRIFIQLLPRFKVQGSQVAIGSKILRRFFPTLEDGILTLIVNSLSVSYFVQVYFAGDVSIWMLSVVFPQ